ncbi:MAG: hypothetical protein LBR71_06650 [Synergistaceae bacterium]|jgi:hypothetical protein|nr:hypothetical protein [Synergistaceae bacterium]
MAQTTRKVDPARILATAKADIDAAERYYSENIEQELTQRYDVYYSSRDRYKKLYPRLSEKNQMRTFDLWSAVEWLLPNLLKAFFSSDRIISISGVGAEDADRAERMMKLLQWQLTVKNQGYRIFKSWFSDALATNLGVLKCYWKRETETTPRRDVMDEAQLVGILENPNARITASQPVPDLGAALGLAPLRTEVSWEETRVTANQPVIEVVRPSDIRFTPDGRTLAECSMVAHRKTVTLDQLRRDARRGIYSESEVEAAGEGDAAAPTELEKNISGSASEESYSSDIWAKEGARKKLTLYECWLKADLDGDGMLEDAIVTVCNDKLLRAVENPYGRTPFFDLVPFWDSYKIWARMGLAEIIQDTQDAHTALLRQMIIGLGLSNQWRAVIDETAINLEDFEQDSMYIRASGSPKDAFLPMTHPGLNPQNFQFFEYLKSQLEEWSPNTRYNQGTDAASLNKTATGISMIMSASQQRQEEIVRNFAETGIRDLFRFLVQLNQRYIDQPQIVRLQNDTLELTPDDLAGDYDLSVDASSGVGAREGKRQALTGYLTQMFGPASQMGAAGPQQFVLAGQKLLRLMGIEDAEKYLTMPQPQPMGPQSMGVQPMGGGTPGDTGGAGQALLERLVGGQGADMPGGAGGVLQG